MPAVASLISVGPTPSTSNTYVIQSCTAIGNSVTVQATVNNMPVTATCSLVTLQQFSTASALQNFLQQLLFNAYAQVQPQAQQQVITLPVTSFTA